MKELTFIDILHNLHTDLFSPDMNEKCLYAKFVTVLAIFYSNIKQFV